MIRLLAQLDDSAQEARFTATPDKALPAPVEVTLDGVVLARIPAGDPGAQTLVLPFEALRDISRGELAFRPGGAPPPPGALRPEGEFFEALALPDAATFFQKVQLNHSRYASPLLLELGARCAHERFTHDPLTRAAALAILGHRHIERLGTQRAPAEEARIAWLLERARPLMAEAWRRLPAHVPDPPRLAWQEVRWSVSLATVAGLLHMAGGDYAAAREMFALPRHCLHHAALSKVSALNMVSGCFLHGVLSHMLGDPDAARASLEAGIEGVKPVVQAQDLMANIWVIGDQVNVMRIARQCFIARSRLGLVPPDAGPEPRLGAAAVLTLDELAVPLPAMARKGLVPRLQEHILRHSRQ
ncbi:hypothetical protein [Roseococcus microcysteis]|uniref:hypothetical protein n=1 Tax=Roseococcus microcysteis TaxID=2771361 RepID=UPI00168B0789|nr:hypothetical protein [Roseococcus microcysteis]